MTQEGAPPQGGEGGCVAAVVRIPVQIVAFVIVLPLRLLWDGLNAAAGAVWRYVLRPPLRVLWRYVVLPLTHWLIEVPSVWLGRHVLLPVLRAIGAAAEFLARYLVKIPFSLLWHHLLAPIPQLLAWAARVLLAVPLAWLWAVLVWPALRGMGRGIAAAWRRGARVSRVIGRAIAAVWRVLVAVPMTWLWRYVLAPVPRAIAWGWRVLVAAPSVWLWAVLVGPALRGVGRGIAAAWRCGVRVSRAVGRAVATAWRVAVAVPVAWAWRMTGAPVLRALRTAGRRLRREVLRPMRETVGQVRRQLRTAMFGPPRKR